MKDIKEIINNIGFKNDFLKYYTLKNIMDLEYFGDLYKNFNLVKLKNNKTSIMKLPENSVSGFSNEMFGSLFLGIGEDDEYESQFIYYEDVEKIFLKKDEFINILNFFDDMLKTKKIKDLRKYLNKKVEKNDFDEILKLSQIGMSSSCESNDVERDIEKLISFFKNLIFNDDGKIKNNKIKTSLYVNEKSKKGIFDILSKEKNNVIFKEKDLNDNKNWNFF